MPTISDVAERAGVSPATVSRVIHGSRNVRRSTRERVERAIQELGYVPSAVAQSLRSKRTRSLALLVPDITNTFWTTVVRGVQDVAQRHGYSVLLCNTDEDLAKQLDYLDFVVRQQVDGAIIAPYDSDAGHLDKLRQRDIPTVIIDRRIEGWEVDSVAGDSVSGSRALVQHLISLGHRRIAMISGPAITSTAEDRVAGYRLALKDAGILFDPRLIHRGEYKSSSGKALLGQVLDEDPPPTAIFAANNALAVGAIDALEERGLRVPQDIALVCFDDLPNTSLIFPFLTVVAQPAYDMGVNAAQLLLSRIHSEVSLQPRHVTLPVRLIVRHSCGSQLGSNGRVPLSLPISKEGLAPGVLVKPLSPDDRRSLASLMDGSGALGLRVPVRLSDYGRSDVNRLLQALDHKEPDRVPHVEFAVNSKRIYEYVLEHELEHDASGWRIASQPVTPEDQVEFALRLGMDAVACEFAWRPRISGTDDLEPPHSLAEQLSYLERYLRAAQGTSVGVVASFTSFFQPALIGMGLADPPDRFAEKRGRFEALMDTLLQNQEKVMLVVCNRFGEDLALILVLDGLADATGLCLGDDVFMELFPQRMAQMVAPAREHNKPLMIQTSGRIANALTMLHELGFHAIHPIECDWAEFSGIRGRYAGKLALVGGIPTSVLVHGSAEDVKGRVQACCAELGPGGGYVLSSTGSITDDVSPKNLVTMARAVHQYGRYGSLGQET
ncbi:MAG: substrate-binding domain-containing protein [Anaerolineae bacterium]|nr:substrate-binding domain-containing protein [Anaerolineae bacterium]